MIYSLKCQYRHLLIQNQIKEYDNAVENGEPLSKIPKIDILQAINFMVTAWNNVSISKGNESRENRPGYMCKTGLKFSDIEEKPSLAITSLYKQIFLETNTNFSGPQILGWNDSELLEQSLVDIEFRPFLIKIDKYNIYVTALGEPDESGSMMKAGIGYTAVLIGEELQNMLKELI